MSEAAREPTIEDIAAARETVASGIPSTVLEAFLPKPITHLGQRLVPISAGHELLFSQLKHPLSTGEKWEDVDVLMALFIFSRPSRELFAMVAEDDLEAEFFTFIDGIPVADIKQLGQDMVAHWLRARTAALAMESPHGGSKKKAQASAGGSTPSVPPAKSTAGFRTWLSMTFRWLSFSR